MSHQPYNIHAGTQIVTKVGVHGSNNALVHSRGAVGIVTRTPCGYEQHWLTTPEASALERGTPIPQHSARR